MPGKSSNDIFPCCNMVMNPMVPSVENHLQQYIQVIFQAADALKIFQSLMARTTLLERAFREGEEWRQRMEVKTDYLKNTWILSTNTHTHIYIYTTIFIEIQRNMFNLDIPPQRHRVVLVENRPIFSGLSRAVRFREAFHLFPAQKGRPRLTKDQNFEDLAGSKEFQTTHGFCRDGICQVLEGNLKSHGRSTYPPPINKALKSGLMNHWYPLNKAWLNLYFWVGGRLGTQQAQASWIRKLHTW